MLDFYLFSFPTHPSWLYALTQGLHVTVGLGVFPILLAKLWSVIPRLFEWPPARTPAHALERLSLMLLVGGALFEFATGILNIQYAYLFGFFFTTAHYYGAWVFIAAFTFHAGLKFGTMRRSLAARRWLAPLRESLAATRVEPGAPAANSLIPVAPAPASMSRRALLGTVGAGSMLLRAPGSRSVDRRAAPRTRVSRPAQPSRQRTERIPDQPHRARRRDLPGSGRGALAAATACARRAEPIVLSGRAARHGPA